MDPLLKPLLLAASIVGGILILVGIWPEDSKEDGENPTSKGENPLGSSNFDVMEIRRLRRELRHQINMKKRFLLAQETASKKG